ncbi:hypothetical protein, partial [Xanthomonas hortorum]|uniref:hypothetical protein n=1 Tax=Xanthomonas hortorum TaxID=56454 RepID=UPI0015E2EB4C
DEHGEQLIQLLLGASRRRWLPGVLVLLGPDARIIHVLLIFARHVEVTEKSIHLVLRTRDGVVA